MVVFRCLYIPPSRTTQIILSHGLLLLPPPLSVGKSALLELKWGLITVCCGWCLQCVCMYWVGGGGCGKIWDFSSCGGEWELLMYQGSQQQHFRHWCLHKDLWYCKYKSVVVVVCLFVVVVKVLLSTYTIQVLSRTSVYIWIDCCKLVMVIKYWCCHYTLYCSPLLLLWLMMCDCVEAGCMLPEMKS